MKILKTLLTGLVTTVLALPLLAMAQESDGPASAGVDETPGAANEEPADEVTVVGQRTMLALRLQMEAAQDEVHRLFNELNTNADYEIVCKVSERYYSRLKEKHCKPQFAWDAALEQGQQYVSDIQQQAVKGSMQGADSNHVIAVKQAGMNDNFVEVLRTSPELFDAVVEHAQLMKKLEEAQATYFGKER